MDGQKYVVFCIGKELYSLPVTHVERILGEQPTTRIPRTPKMVLGVFDLRGETLPAIDLRARFEFPEFDGSGSYVVVQNSEAKFALRVDSIEAIWEFGADEIEPKPSFVRGDADEFMSGVVKHEDRLVVVLDPEHVIPKHVEAKVAKLKVAA